MLGGILLGQNLIDLRLAFHGPLDRQLGGLVVVLVNLIVILGLPVDEYAADDHQVFGVGLGNNAGGDAIGHGLGNGGLGGAEHLHGLGRPLDRNLGNEDRRRLANPVS